MRALLPAAPEARPIVSLARPSYILIAAVIATTSARGQVAPAPAVAAPDQGERASVLRGVDFLKGRGPGAQVGEAALAALALVKAEVPATDPGLGQCLQRALAGFSGSTYTPERRGGADVYEAAVLSVLLANLDAKSYQPQIQSLAAYLMGLQKPNGSWDYVARSAGDTSISQYAVLGLWEAENAGVPIPPRVWERAARWFMSVQSSQGSWNYHRDEAQHPETISMTAAGVGSLLICKMQLDNYRRDRVATNPLLKPLTAEGEAPPYEVDLPAAPIDAAVKRGLGWLGKFFKTGSDQVVGQSPFYALYGIERIGALGGRDSLGGVDWYDQGVRYILGQQRADGGWSAQHGEMPNTAWAVLFMTKATAKSVKRIEIKRLGAGTLLGGRGLPKDLSSLTVAQGRVVVRPMNGAVEGMLAVLEDPRATDATSALAGIVTRYQAEGPAVLRPLAPRFRKLLLDPDPGVRRLSAWALARAGQIDAVPDLIGALEDVDEAVVGEAAAGLLLLSRKLDGFGPDPGASLDDRRRAGARWRAWYDGLRPPELDADVADGSTPATGARP